MKRQIIALVAGAALVAAPLMTNVATAKGMGGHGGPRIEQLAKKLNLTDAQKTQLEGIKSRTQAKVRAILTAEQQAKFDAAKAARDQRRAAMQANGGKRPEGTAKGDYKGARDKMGKLNLTDAQKTQIKAIHQAAKAEMDSVLTPAQKAQLEQLKQQRQERKGQRKAG
jgi:periplasmic protein CpxP/Spy